MHHLIDGLKKGHRWLADDPTFRPEGLKGRASMADDLTSWPGPPGAERKGKWRKA